MLHPLWRTIWRFLKKLKIEFPYDPSILLMDIYSNKTIIQKYACISVFTVQEEGVQSLGWEDLLEKEMVTHSSTLVWEISRTEEPGGLQSMGSQRVGHNLVTKQRQLNVYTNIHINTMGYYSAIKKNETMPFTPTWMEREIIILSEVSQKQNSDLLHLVW